MNGRPLSLTRPANRTGEPEPPRHVIDQYKHREQTITCVCGASLVPNPQTRTRGRDPFIKGGLHPLDGLRQPEIELSSDTRLT